MKVEYYGFGKMRFPGICWKCNQPMRSGEAAYFIRVGRSKKTAHPGCKDGEVAAVPKQDIPEEIKNNQTVLEILQVFDGSVLMAVSIGTGERSRGKWSDPL